MTEGGLWFPFSANAGDLKMRHVLQGRQDEPVAHKHARRSRGVRPVRDRGKCRDLYRGHRAWRGEGSSRTWDGIVGKGSIADGTELRLQGDRLGVWKPDPDNSNGLIFDRVEGALSRVPDSALPDAFKLVCTGCET